MKPLLFTALSLIAALAFALSAARLLSGLLAAGRNRKAKAHAQTTEKAVPSGRRARMRALILTAVFGWIAVYALPRSGLALLRPAELAEAFSVPVTWLTAAGLVVFSTVLPYILYTRGLSQVESGKASIMASLEPVVASLAGVLVFSEPISGVTLAGIVCVLAGVYILR